MANIESQHNETESETFEFLRRKISKYLVPRGNYMGVKKRIFFAIISVILTVVCVVPAYAEESYPYTWEDIYFYCADSDILKILEKNISDRERTAIESGFGRVEYLGNIVDGFQAPSKSIPIVKIYNKGDWEKYASLSLEELVAEGERGTVCYEFICDYSEEFRSHGLEMLETRGLRIRTGGSRNILQTSMLRMGVMNDIKDMLLKREAKLVLLGNSCTVSDIYFFEDFAYGVTLVYFSTDKGVYVKYYDHASSALTFSEEQFTTRVNSYIEYKNDLYENEGENIYGSGISFLEYLTTEYEESIHADEQIGKPHYVVVVICSCAFALAVATFTNFCIKCCKKRKAR